MDMDEINLDCMDRDELEDFATEATNGLRPVNLARTLFPHRPAGYVRATRELGHYAWNKLTAMGCRKRGDVSSALVYEEICDRIYATLPEWARW
jgi:hypothetical protein